MVPRIGITFGDPGGIGPEIILKTFSGEFSLPRACYIFFGSSLVIKNEEEALGIKLDLQPWDKKNIAGSPGLFLQEVENPLTAIKKGFPSVENGMASFLFFREAVEEAAKGGLQAIVTAPISKKSWDLAGVRWRGHTEYLNQAYPQAIMTFWSEKLKVALLSHHLPLKLALEKVKKNILLDYFRHLHQIIEKLKPREFEFLVAGLNPHAGEEGLLGSEEKKEIIPAIKQAQQQGIRISGPFPPDVIFRNALGLPDKIIIALYHDQGLVAFKLESFDTGVNTTLGLPFIRTSPDHGTAFDIAGRNLARPQSMIEAIKLAYYLIPRSF